MKKFPKWLKAQVSRYPKYVEWSDEDGVFIGRCPNLFGGGVHGNNEAAVYAELCEVVEEWIEILHKDGKLPEALDPKKYSGEFMVRLEPELHRRLASKALAEGESLNQFVVKKLVKA